MQYKKYLILTTFLIWIFGFGVSSAVSIAPTNIYFEIKDFNQDSADEVVIDILVDSLVAVNAYDIVFKYPENLLELKYANMADSIIDVVPEEISSDGLGRIIIRGGSTQAFKGERGRMARLHFTAKAIGASNIGFISATIHLADGSGTAIEPMAYHAREFAIRGLLEVAPDQPIVIPIDETGKAEQKFVDTVSPKILSMQIVKDPFDKTNWLLVFEGKDSESGILHYLLRERHWLLFGSQTRVNNPHSVSPGAWAIELVAVDNFGNETKKTIHRWSALGWKLLFILVLVLAVWAVARMYKSWHKARSVGNAEKVN